MSNVPLTPLTPYFEGLAQVTSWFSYTATQNLSIVRYRLTARDAPTGSSLLVTISKNSVVQATITLAADQTDTGHIAVSIAYSSNDIISFEITQVGSDNPGSGLQLIADINATNLTMITQTQSPYLIQQEGVIALGTVFTYTLARTVNLKTGEFQLRTAPTGASAILAIRKNGVTQQSLTILAGQTDSGLVSFSINFIPGDVLTLVITQIGSITAGSDLIVTLNYDLLDLIPENLGQFYSEPDSEVIAFLKQIGIGNAAADSITTDQLTPYKRRANEIIDAEVGSLYRTPIRTISRNLRTYYPEPIGFIAQRIVAYLLVNDIFSEVEPNATSNAKTNYDYAMTKLYDVVQRKTILKGQRMRSISYGSNPYTAPLVVNQASDVGPRG